MTIDWWTLGLQTVNVLILIWLLGRFFWRPVAAMIEHRRSVAQSLLAEAEAKRNQAAGALVEIERTRAGFAAERESVLAAARADAERERAARVEQAARDVAGLEAAARTMIAQERGAADKVWAERATQLGVAIAERLAARLTGAAVNAAFLDFLLRGIKALPETSLQALASCEADLQVVSAGALEPAEQQRTRSSIGEALGAPVAITFLVEPALIAGLELRGSHVTVGNSWRADLAQITANLLHDQQR